MDGLPRWEPTRWAPTGRGLVMKKGLGLALLALPLLTTPSFAQCGGGGGCGISGGFGFRFSLGFTGNLNAGCAGGCGSGCGMGGCGSPGGPGYGGGGQLAPWYNYWPLQAHFNAPAPTGYPYWPAPQAPLPSAASAGPGLQPVGYYGSAPSYWYGR